MKNELQIDNMSYHIYQRSVTYANIHRDSLENLQYDFTDETFLFQSNKDIQYIINRKDEHCKLYIYHVQLL